MKEIDIKDFELETLQFISQGACASVYRLDETTAIKVLNDKGKEMTDLNQLSKLVGIKVDDISGHGQFRDLPPVEHEETSNKNGNHIIEDDSL